MKHFLVCLLAGTIGGPLLLIGGGYVVAFWSTVATMLLLVFGGFVLLVVVEMARQQAESRAGRERYDADARARAALRPPML